VPVDGAGSSALGWTRKWRAFQRASASGRRPSSRPPGKITNELARRAKAATLHGLPAHSEALELERAEETRMAANTNCNWPAERGQQGSYGKQILEEVRHEFASREKDSPLCPKHAETPFHKTILRSKPSRSIDDNATAIRWYHEWFFHWTYHAFPNRDIRDAALDLALQMQPGR